MEVRGINRRKNADNLNYCINGADYGHGGSLEARLCKLNRPERWRWLQEQTEMMRSMLETWRLTGRDCNSI
jgi:hypothetical protein